MLKMYYSEDGKAYSDFKAEEVIADLVNRIANGESEVIRFSTENMAYAVRVAVQSGMIPAEKLMLDMGEGDVGVDSDGRLKNSAGYIVLSDKWLDALL